MERILERLAEPGTSSRFLVVVGPSGSGKSSLVRAGLIPALRQGRVRGSHRWLVTSMYPGSDPVGRLTEILADTNETEPQLLVIDQFEELFVLTGPDTHTAFLGMIEELVTGMRPIRVVCTLRADFLDRPLSYPSFARLVDIGLMLVTPLGDDDVRAAVIEPAASMGVRVEPELAAALIGDVASRAATLPLLQYTLTELFEHRRGNTLTLDAYRAAGGISGALARRADQTYLELDDTEQEATRQVFLHLVTVTADAEHLRRRVAVEELTGLPLDATSLEHVLDRFGRQRLLTFDRNPVSARPTVEVAHEALLKEWPRLWDWVENNREDIRTDHLLAADVTVWTEAGRELPPSSRLLLSPSAIAPGTRRPWSSNRCGPPPPATWRAMPATSWRRIRSYPCCCRSKRSISPGTPAIPWLGMPSAAFTRPSSPAPGRPPCGVLERSPGARTARDCWPETRTHRSRRRSSSMWRPARRLTSSPECSKPAVSPGARTEVWSPPATNVALPSSGRQPRASGFRLSPKRCDTSGNCPSVRTAHYWRVAISGITP